MGPSSNQSQSYPPPGAGPYPPQGNAMPAPQQPYPQQQMQQTAMPYPTQAPMAPPPPAFPAAQMPQQPGVQQPATIAPKANPNSTQNALQIAEVRDGIVIMNDGSFRSVVMVKSINFDLMSPQEREAVEFSYQGFLNSLYFPVQINVRSQKVDLGPYIQKLVKIRGEHDNMLLALLMDDYITFMDQLSQQTNIMDKKFYIIIPYFTVADAQKTLDDSKKLLGGISTLFSKKPEHQVTINENDLTAAKDELRNRVQAVLGALQQCGIQGLPLDTQELIELYYDTYNPDTATRQELKNFNDLSVPVVTKGEGMAPQPGLDKELQ